MAQYPSLVSTFTTKANEVDVVDASHVNILQDEVIALQQYIGTTPHGSATDLTTRLGVMIATNGAFAQGTVFPTGAGLKNGQPFYRTDEDVLYIYDGVAWDSQIAALSNIAFSATFGCAFATQATGEDHWGYYARGSTGSTFSGYFLSLMTRSTVYKTLWMSRFKKIAGQSSIKIDAVVQGSGLWYWAVSGTAASVAENHTNAEFLTAGPTIDISGLATGTYYDVIFQMRASIAGGGGLAHIYNFVGTLS